MVFHKVGLFGFRREDSMRAVTVREIRATESDTARAASSPGNVSSDASAIQSAQTIQQQGKQGALVHHVLAGFTTAIASSYAMFAVPGVLSAQLGVPYAGALTGTVLLTASMTLCMGLFARLPFVVVPSIGTCAVLGTLVASQGIPWQVALGISFWTGLAFIAISFTSLREKMAVAIPPVVREAASIGVGLLLIRAALQMGGVWNYGEVFLCVPSTLTLFGMALIVLLLRIAPRYAFVTVIPAVTLVGLWSGSVSWPAQFFAWPEFSQVSSQVRIVDALSIALIPLILTLFFTDLVDSLATFVSVSESMGLVSDNRPKNLGRGLFVDSLATFVAPFFGTTPGSTCLQSVVASETVKPTGTTAVCAALWYLPCIFLSPLAMMIPEVAVSPILLVVGIKMFASLTALKVHFETLNHQDALTMLDTVITVAITGSIAEGVLLGCLLWSLLNISRWGRRQPAAGTYWLAAIGVLYLCYARFGAS